MWWRSLIAVGIGAACAYLLLVVVLAVYARRHREAIAGRDAFRLAGSVLRLLPRLAREPELPWICRVAVFALVLYLASPIDLVPDVIPVLGYADDVVAVVLVLRFVIRRAGPDVIRRQWTGDAPGLAVVERWLAPGPQS